MTLTNLPVALLQKSPLIKVIADRGNARDVSGGRSIVQEIGGPSSVHMPKWFVGYRSVPEHYLPQAETPSAAEFPWRQCAATSSQDLIDHIVEGISSGERARGFYSGYQTLDFVNGWYWNSISIYSLIGANAAAVGGIDPRQFPFWRNYYLKRGTVPLREAMEIMYDGLCGGNTFPDLILMNDNDHDQIGAPSHFNQATVVRDTRAKPIVHGERILATPVLFINTKYLFLRTHERRALVKLETDKFTAPPGTEIYAWTGNLTTCCMYVHGCLA
jgi:hypothetical protein